jgi:hypothetical protein
MRHSAKLFTRKIQLLLLGIRCPRAALKTFAHEKKPFVIGYAHLAHTGMLVLPLEHHAARLSKPVTDCLGLGEKFPKENL